MGQLSLFPSAAKTPNKDVLTVSTPWYERIERDHKVPSGSNPGCGVKCGRCGHIGLSTFSEVLAWSNGYDIGGQTKFKARPVICQGCARELTKEDFREAWVKDGTVRLKYPWPGDDESLARFAVQNRRDYAIK